MLKQLFFIIGQLIHMNEHVVNIHTEDFRNSLPLFIINMLYINKVTAGGNRHRTYRGTVDGHRRENGGCSRGILNDEKIVVGDVLLNHHLFTFVQLLHKNVFIPPIQIEGIRSFHPDGGKKVGCINIVTLAGFRLYEICHAMPEVLTDEILVVGDIGPKQNFVILGQLIHHNVLITILIQAEASYSSLPLIGGYVGRINIAAGRAQEA